MDIEIYTTQSTKRWSGSIQMQHEHSLAKAFDKIRQDLQHVIDLSIEEDDKS